VHLLHGRVIDLDITFSNLTHLGTILGHLLFPRPSVSEEDLRQDVQIGGFGATVVRGDTDGNSIGILFIFGVLRGFSI
jgi:hypothetical protein